jgi:hypothetical protein
MCSMMRIFIFFLLIFAGQIAFGQTNYVLKSFVYRKSQGKILFQTDTTTIVVKNDTLHFNNNIYKFKNDTIALNNIVIGRMSEKHLIINNNIYNVVKGKDEFTWRYERDSLTLLDCHAGKDETDVFSVVMIAANDSIPDREVLEAVALKKYSAIIKPKGEHERTYLYICLGILQGVIFYILATSN